MPWNYLLGISEVQQGNSQAQAQANWHAQMTQERWLYQQARNGWGQTVPLGSSSIQSGAAIQLQALQPTEHKKDTLMGKDLSKEFDRYMEIVDEKLP